MGLDCAGAAAAASFGADEVVDCTGAAAATSFGADARDS
jgi:hypothetical protein